MQNIFHYIFLIILLPVSTFAVDNIGLIQKLNEQKDFYKNQPRLKKTVNLNEITLPSSFNDEIIDLEAEFKKAETPSSRRRLR